MCPSGEISFLSIRTLSALVVALASLVATVPGCQAPPRPTEKIRSNADFLYNRGDYADAASEYAEITARYPGDWQAQYRLGKCLLETRQYPASRRALEIAHTAQPNNQEIADALAECMFQQKDSSRLFAFLRERADADRSVHSHMRLGEYAMESGDPDSAKTAIETAIEVDGGKTVEPYLLAADFEQSLGNMDGVARRLRQAYGIRPDDRRVLDRLEAMGEVIGPTLALPPGR